MGTIGTGGSAGAGTGGSGLHLNRHPLVVYDKPAHNYHFDHDPGDDDRATHHGAAHHGAAHHGARAADDSRANPSRAADLTSGTSARGVDRPLSHPGCVLFAAGCRCYEERHTDGLRPGLRRQESLA